MKFKSLLLTLTFVMAAPLAVRAQAQATTSAPAVDNNMMDELDPFDPNINQTLQEMDKAYEAETGNSAHLPQVSHPNLNGITTFSAGCVRQTCAVWAQVVKSRQKMYLYVNGQLEGTYSTSTGVPGRDTPNFDTHPDGRIYDSYTSSKYPGGDYKGLGNMPYAVFISGGFAIHGTAQSNWQYLGRPASHGCIRIHPDNAYHFNRLVRQVGIANTWITVQD